VKKLKEQYRAGGLGDVVLKERLVGVLQGLIRPMRERRATFAKDPAAVRKMLQEGTERARAVVRETLREVKRAMKIDYFG
jgi:tryptophanyl-tRNA synthetase